MNISFFVKGLIIGFSIAAPVGPIGVLCIHRTLTQGCAIGLVSGLGAATADAIYGSIAGLGLTFLSSFLIHQRLWLKLLGGVFLFYLGIKTWVSLPAQQAAQAKGKSLIRAYISTFFLTLTNPMTLLSFAAIFAGLGLVSDHTNSISAMVWVGGVFTGSALWWLLLCVGIGLFRTKLTPTRLRWINRISGLMITMFGLFALL